VLVIGLKASVDKAKSAAEFWDDEVFNPFNGFKLSNTSLAGALLLLLLFKKPLLALLPVNCCFNTKLLLLLFIDPPVLWF